MRFWASAEVYQPALQALTAVRRCVEKLINEEISKSDLLSLNGKIRYVPIVMPVEMHARYPERSKLRRKERIYDCAPQLDFNLFVGDDFEAQVREYVRGIAFSVPHISAFGASAEQIEKFEQILKSTIDKAVVERPDQIRH